MRPQLYTEEMANKLLERLIEPRQLSSICKDADMPSAATVYRWRHENPDFERRYRVALEQQCEMYVGEIFDIADDASGDDIVDAKGNVRPNHEWINRSRLKVDTRKWYASKVAWRLFGDKVEQTIVGDNTRPLVVNSEIAGKSSDELIAMIQGFTNGNKP